MFSEVAGDIYTPEKLVLRAEGVYLMDIGSEAYTEATMGDSIIDIYDEYPKADPSVTKRNKWRLGMIHTHHSMRAFFSGTDMEELRDNTPHNVYYLSLIVNFDMAYCAKVAYIAEKEETIDTKVVISGFRKPRVIRSTETVKKKVMYIIDMDIYHEEETGFSKRFDTVKKEKEEQARLKREAASIAASRAIPSGGYTRHWENQNEYYEGYGRERSNSNVGGFQKKKEEETEVSQPKGGETIQKFIYSWLLSTSMTLSIFQQEKPLYIFNLIKLVEEKYTEEQKKTHIAFVLDNLARVYQAYYGKAPGTDKMMFMMRMEEVLDLLERHEESSAYARDLKFCLEGYLNSEVIYSLDAETV